MQLKAGAKKSLPFVLPRSFYLDSPEAVASNLLGKLITRHLDGKRLTGRIIEVEAYLGFSDPAAHTGRPYLYWQDTAQCGALRASRLFLCLFHLRDALLP